MMAIKLTQFDVSIFTRFNTEVKFPFSLIIWFLLLRISFEWKGKYWNQAKKWNLSKFYNVLSSIGQAVLARQPQINPIPPLNIWCFRVNTIKNMPITVTWSSKLSFSAWIIGFRKKIEIFAKQCTTNTEYWFDKSK